MDRIEVDALSLKAEVEAALQDFETWPDWAKELPIENSDRVMSEVLEHAKVVTPLREVRSGGNGNGGFAERQGSK